MTSTKPLTPVVNHGNASYADLKMPEDPLVQSPAPKMITGLTTATFNPSAIPRHTSISAKYFVFPYSLLLVSEVQFIVSSIGVPIRIRPNAATELT